MEELSGNDKLNSFSVDLRCTLDAVICTQWQFCHQIYMYIFSAKTTSFQHYPTLQGVTVFLNDGIEGFDLQVTDPLTIMSDRNIWEITTATTATHSLMLPFWDKLIPQSTTQKSSLC